jgi:inorganic pyrophosphatase
MDICVLTEKDISHGDIISRRSRSAGLRMIDGAEADDKIIAVLQDDAMFGGWRDLHDAPPALVERPAPLLPHLQAGPRRGTRRGSRSPMSTTATKPTT